MIYLSLAALLLTVALVGWQIYNLAWQRGYRYGYSAGLLADDKLEITFEPEEWE